MSKEKVGGGIFFSGPKPEKIFDFGLANEKKAHFPKVRGAYIKIFAFINMTPYQIHGLIQLLVFLILFPTGATIALLRDKIGPSWRRIHVTIQLTGVALYLTAVSIAFYANQQRNVSTQDKPFINQLHIWVGRTVGTLILLQVIWAFFGRSWVIWDTWYAIHMTLSALIILGGLTNIIIAVTMMKNKKKADEESK